MNNCTLRIRRSIAIVLAVCLFMPVTAPAASLQPATVKSWDTYVQLTEQRIASELDGQRFLIMDTKGGPETNKIRQELKKGEIHIERMTTQDAKRHDVAIEGGLAHHWYGAVFLPGVNLQRVLKFVQSYDDHYRYFKEVERSRLISRQGDTFKIYYRLFRSKLTQTVHYNTEHTAIYRTHDKTRASSRSFTTRIAELENVGTQKEKEKPVGNDNGYLWRLNSYWRFQEADGGVYVECESVSLSRSIPWPLGYVPGLNGLVESLPRESMQNTLSSIRDGLSAETKASN